MQTNQRPQSLRLRKVTRSHDPDIGNLHVIDYYLTLACAFHASPQFALPRIGRYLDGEEDKDGTYR